MAKLVKKWHDGNHQDVIRSQYYVDENGVMNGECRTWTWDGKLESKCSYVNGKIVGTKSYFDSDGRVMQEVDYDFDGCPFIIKFYADEWTEEYSRSIGMVPGIEDLTLSGIMRRFEELMQEKTMLEDKLAHYEKQQTTQERAKDFIHLNAPTDRSRRTTFT